MAKEPPVQGEGAEGSEGAGREKRPRKGEVETPWPFPAQPVSQPFLPAAVRRGWGNPRRGTMTWRKTETETDRDSEIQRERQRQEKRQRKMEIDTRTQTRR